MNPNQLSYELRQGHGPFLARRRGIVGLSLVSMASMGIITLYQTGVIPHLPEPPGFDADTVDAAAQAYQYGLTPDAALGMVSYATTLALAAMGGRDRATDQLLIPLALVAKVAVDALNAGKLTWDQWSKHRAFCSYCLIAAAATFAMVPLAVPEARAAYRQLTT